MRTDNRIIRMPQVIDMVGVCKASIYLMVKRGDFPAPLKLGPRASGWVLAEIEAWISERANARGQ